MPSYRIRTRRIEVLEYVLPYAADFNKAREIAEAELQLPKGKREILQLDGGNLGLEEIQVIEESTHESVVVEPEELPGLEVPEAQWRPKLAEVVVARYRTGSPKGPMVREVVGRVMSVKHGLYEVVWAEFKKNSKTAYVLRRKNFQLEQLDHGRPMEPGAENALNQLLELQPTG